MTTEAESSPAGPPAGLTLPPPELRRVLRQFAGETQEDVAADFGVSDGAVSYWERRRPGRRHLRGYLLRLLAWADAANATGMPVGWPQQADVPQK